MPVRRRRPRPMLPLLLASAAAFALPLGSPLLRAQDPSPAGQATSGQAATSPDAAKAPPPNAAEAIGDLERSAITITAYDLSVQLHPRDASLTALGRITVRNDGAAPLPGIALQISSTLHWDAISQRIGDRTEKLSFDQHPLETDADHTGQTSEAVIHLLHPLAPGGTADLSVFYSGSILRSTGRLDRLETPSSSSGASDWDSISAERTTLRGFGDVLWFPTASPQIFLGEGAALLEAEEQQLARGARSPVHLRLSVDYTGDPPAVAFFCGREEALTPVSDDPNAPAAETSGVATADFATEPLGLRTPSLFVTEKPTLSADGTIAAVSTDAGLADRLATAAAPARSLIADWFGGNATRPLTVLDHRGDAFAEGSLLVAPVSSADPASLASALLPSLVHARFRSAHAWLDSGLPQWMSLLLIERKEGRPAAIDALEEQTHALTLAESAAPPDPAGGGLLTATRAIFTRNKAAAVLWMLRDLAGDEPLRRALRAYVRDPGIDTSDTAFERLVEENSGKDLRWFFDDWVYHDRGLPDLTIVSVSPRELPSGASASATQRLVAIEIRNDGGAAADVPVTVRSGTLTATERLRVGAHASASTRILFQGIPEQVQVNDGSVPEMIANVHTLDVPAATH